MKYLKSYSNQYYTNESIKDYLKPKSEEDIYKLTKNLSTDEKIEYGITYDLDWLVREAIEEGFKLNINHLLRSLMTNKLNVAKMIIVNNLVNLSDDDNQCILQAVSRGYTEILELLLKDKRIDPTMGGFNFPLRDALNRGNFDIVELLLNDKRVRNSLSRKQRLKYESQIKNNRNITESIKDFLKPKSEDEVSDALKKLPPEERIKNGLKFNVFKLEDIPEVCKDMGKKDRLKIGLKYKVPILIEDSLRRGAKYHDIEYYHYIFSSCVREDRLDIIRILYNYIHQREKDMILDDACRYNKLEIAQFAVENGADINAKDELYLLDPVEKGHTEIVKFLIEQGVDIHRETTREDRGERFLISAVKKGHYKIVKLLLENGADPSYQDEIALKIASKSKSKKKIYDLLKEYVNKKRMKKIKNFFGLDESVKDFLKPKSEDEIMSKMEGLSPYKKFYRGCQHGIIQYVKQAVEEGINVKVENQVGLRMASDKGYLDIVKYLLSMYKNWDIISDEAVKNAAKKDHSEILKLFLNDKRCEFDPTENNYYIIHYCAINKKYKSLKVLLNNDIVNNKWNGEMDKYEKQLEEYENNK